ncbi:hypothetical protein Hesp01_61310 [Herbidospora sp. NBRC 101105]|nr:hypothetical protein Hesp01_61310 [Herbidospora sp. NBRC 101105]
MGECNWEWLFIIDRSRVDPDRGGDRMNTGARNNRSASRSVGGRATSPSRRAGIGDPNGFGGGAGRVGNF